MSETLQKVNNDLKDAMRAKDALRLEVLRNIKSAVTNELVATGRTPQDEASEEEVMVVIKRLAKQRKDSMEQFRNAGRDELAEKEERELAILTAYLPQMMEREEVEAIVAKVCGEMGEDATMGMVMGAVMKRTSGRADGALVREIVESKLTDN